MVYTMNAFAIDLLVVLSALLVAQQVNGFAGLTVQFETLRMIRSSSSSTTTVGVRPQDFAAGKIGLPLPFRGFPMPDRSYDEDLKEAEEIVDKPAVPEPVVAPPPKPVLQPPPQPTLAIPKSIPPIPAAIQPSPESEPKVFPVPAPVDKEQSKEPLKDIEPAKATDTNPIPAKDDEPTKEATIEPVKDVVPTKTIDPKPATTTATEPVKEAAPGKQPISEATKEDSKDLSKEKDSKPPTDPIKDLPLPPKVSPELPATTIEAISVPAIRIPTAEPTTTASATAVSVFNTLASNVPLPLLAIPIAAIVAGRAILTDREAKKRDIELEIFAAQQRREEAIEGSNNLVLTLVGAAAVSVAAILLALTENTIGNP